MQQQVGTPYFGKTMGIIQLKRLLVSKFHELQIDQHGIWFPLQNGFTDRQNIVITIKDNIH
jgi:hypothetical protein